MEKGDGRNFAQICDAVEILYVTKKRRFTASIFLIVVFINFRLFFDRINSLLQFVAAAKCKDCKKAGNQGNKFFHGSASFKVRVFS